MSKFILHGGFSKENSPLQESDIFFREMLKETSKEVNILLVYFAEREEMIELRIKQDKEQLNKNNEVNLLHFRVASEKNFKEDCKWADVIYLHGGKTIKLMGILKKFSDVKKMFSNKTIAGDSAGANALCQLFYSKNSRKIGEGLRILPFKIVSHYLKGTPNPLANTEPQLETVFLSEYEMKVFHEQI